jgi:hypothetical protein
VSDRGVFRRPGRLRDVELAVALFDAASPLVPLRAPPRSIAVGATGTTLIEEVRFALDSPLEEHGFELSVPLGARLRDHLSRLMPDTVHVEGIQADLPWHLVFLASAGPAPAATAAPLTPTTPPSAIRSWSRSIGRAKERWPAGNHRRRTNILARMEPG